MEEPWIRSQEILILFRVLPLMGWVDLDKSFNLSGWHHNKYLTIGLEPRLLYIKE